ncbi:MAG: redoxin domain-containing protein [Chloroflexota bacterium]
MQNSEPVTSQPRGRNPLLLVLGFALLGAAVAMLLFGSNLFQREAPAEPGATILEQVPNFATSQPGVGQVANSDFSYVRVGDQAPDFVLNDLDGQPVGLKDFRGRPVILNFWATWCGPCRIEMPELQAIYEKYQEQGLVILALDQDETAEVVRPFFYEEMGLTFTPLLDERARVGTLYGAAFTLPSSYFVNPEGIVTAVHRGPMTGEQIEGYLADTMKSN